MNTNPSDILELISRGAADPLTDAERLIIERAIAADPGLVGERDAYARLDALLSRFTVLPKGVDWDELSGMIASEIRDEAALDIEADDDALIETLSGPLPDVDWDAFHTRVSNAVRDEAAAESQQTIKWPALFSWVAPLAAAAMIAIVVWGPFGVRNQDAGSSNPIAKIAPPAPMTVVQVELGAPMASGMVAITFDESSPEDAPAPTETGVMAGGTVIVDGSWPTEDASMQVELEAYYY